MSGPVRVALAVALVLPLSLLPLLPSSAAVPSLTATTAAEAGTASASTATATTATLPARTATASGTAPTTRVVSYRAPVPGPLRVLRGFDPPLTPYGPGHRGADLSAVGPVLAAADGVVRFAGSVAGRGVVVLVHPDGIRTEYEPVRPAVRAGQRVRAGQLIGVVSGRHPGCPGSCLHWGARRAERYLDPLALLRPLGPVRLLPWGRAAT